MLWEREFETTIEKETPKRGMVRINVRSKRGGKMTSEGKEGKAKRGVGRGKTKPIFPGKGKQKKGPDKIETIDF